MRRRCGFGVPREVNRQHVPKLARKWKYTKANSHSSKTERVENVRTIYVCGVLCEKSGDENARADAGARGDVPKYILYIYDDIQTSGATMRHIKELYARWSSIDVRRVCVFYQE